MGHIMHEIIKSYSGEYNRKALEVFDLRFCPRWWRRGNRPTCRFRRMPSKPLRVSYLSVSVSSLFLRSPLRSISLASSVTRPHPPPATMQVRRYLIRLMTGEYIIVAFIKWVKMLAKDDSGGFREQIQP